MNKTGSESSGKTINSKMPRKYVTVMGRVVVKKPKVEIRIPFETGVMVY